MPTGCSRGFRPALRIFGPSSPAITLTASPPGPGTLSIRPHSQCKLLQKDGGQTLLIRGREEHLLLPLPGATRPRPDQA